MKSTVRMYNIAKGTEFLCDQSKGNSWKVICKNNMLGYTYKEDHCNLNSNMIATSLIPYIIENLNIAIKMIPEIIKGLNHYTPSYRKAQKARRKAFVMVRALNLGHGSWHYYGSMLLSCVQESALFLTAIKNGALKKVRGLPVTAMGRLTVKALIDRFVERSTLANALLEQNKSWPLSVEK
ncbi:hypothetical protein MTR67_051717 [Solanum verrucosum]|uniref:Uncharacterized protein n=1 Tax=Solanum verrucosum TaxID=315347 RepID=A0AAF0V5H8_SOLVR|nr:hypothetical protein MTR67_051717 [Solanum verrucosum]